MTRSARAAVFHGPGRPHELRDFPLPAELAPGEVVVRVTCATVCGSDLHTVEGRRVEPTPCVLGHEGVGVVEATGAGREALRGRRVTWASSAGCGRCAVCVDHQLPQKCPDVLKYGHVAVGPDGALRGTYATHVVLRPGTHVVPLPDELPDAAAAPTNCALATMVAATEQRPAHSRVAVVQGAGLLGLYGCALLRAAGVDRVVVVDRDPARLELVAAFGGEPADGTARARVDARGADLVVEACGRPEVLDEGFELLRVGGHYTLVGAVQPGPPLPFGAEDLVRRCATVRGVHNYAPRHLDAAVAFLTERHRALPLGDVIAPARPLEEIDAVLARAGEGGALREALAPEDLAPEDLAPEVRA